MREGTDPPRCARPLPGLCSPCSRVDLPAIIVSLLRPHVPRRCNLAARRSRPVTAGPQRWVRAPAALDARVPPGLAPRGSAAVILAEVSVLSALHAKFLPLPAHPANPRYPSSPSDRVACSVRAAAPVGHVTWGLLPLWVPAPRHGQVEHVHPAGATIATPARYAARGLPRSGDVPITDCCMSE